MWNPGHASADDGRSHSSRVSPKALRTKGAVAASHTTALSSLHHTPIHINKLQLRQPQHARQLMKTQHVSTAAAEQHILLSSVLQQSPVALFDGSKLSAVGHYLSKIDALPEQFSSTKVSDMWPCDIMYTQHVPAFLKIEACMVSCN